jgi:monoamine oxidase
MKAALNTMSPPAEPVDADAPWKTPNAAELDRKTIADWIKGLEASDLCKAAIDAQLAGDNGVANDKASLLGMLAAVKGGGLDKYWTETEVYRCKGGNDQLAAKFAAEIGERIVTRLRVRSVELKGENVVVTCADDRTLECDDVVLAVAPSAWNTIEFKPGFPGAIEPGRGVQMGTNVKYLTHVKKRFWQEHNEDPAALSNDLFTWTWDATDGQDDPVPAAASADAKEKAKDNPNPPDKVACLTAFAGGPAAEKFRALSSDKRTAAITETLEKVYPGFTENKVASRFMDWPGVKYVGAGYSFPAPGQVTTAGPVLAAGLGKVHFAGEHCCYKFVGYMEGALQSGVAVAKRLAVRDGVTK